MINVPAKRGHTQSKCTVCYDSNPAALKIWRRVDGTGSVVNCKLGMTQRRGVNPWSCVLVE